MALHTDLPIYKTGVELLALAEPKRCEYCCGTGRFSDHDCRFCAGKGEGSVFKAAHPPAQPQEQTK